MTEAQYNLKCDEINDIISKIDSLVLESSNVFDTRSHSKIAIDGSMNLKRNKTKAEEFDAKLASFRDTMNNELTFLKRELDSRKSELKKKVKKDD